MKPQAHIVLRVLSKLLCCSKSLSSLSAIRVLKELLYVTFSNVECLKMEWNLEMIICLGRQTLRNKRKNKPTRNKGWSRMANDGHGSSKDGQGWARMGMMMDKIDTYGKWRISRNYGSFFESAHSALLSSLSLSPFPLLIALLFWLTL